MSNKPFNLNESVINSVRSVLVSSQEQEINSLVEQATSLFFAHNKDASKTLPVFVKEYVMKKTMNPTLATICETVAKDNEKNLTETVEGKGPQMLNEAAGSTPRTPKEKKLAAMAHPKDKITHKDVLVGRGVVAKEEVKQIDELKSSTLASYTVKASKSAMGTAAGDSRTTKNRKFGIERAVSKLYKRAPDAPKDPWEDPKFYNAQFKNRQESTDTPGNSYKHQCAIHVKHEQFGEGKTIYSQHAEPDQDGNIAWYDVMFEHGIEKKVSINEIQVLQSESHMMHKKKKMKEDVEQIDEISAAYRRMLKYQKKKKMKEEVEQVDEISNKLKNDYLRKAGESLKKSAPFSKEEDKRSTGIARAKGLIPTKEETQLVDEMMSDPETLRADRSAKTTTTPSGRKIVVKKPKKELKVEDVNQNNGGESSSLNGNKKEKTTKWDAIVKMDSDSSRVRERYHATDRKDAAAYDKHRAIKNKEYENYQNSKSDNERKNMLNRSLAKKLGVPYYGESVGSYAKEDVEYVDEAKRGRPRKNPLPAGQAPEEGDKEHFIMQLRKSVSMRGKKDVEFDNGEKMKVPAHVASAVLDHYNSLKTAEQKDRLHKSVSKTPKHLMSHYEMYHGN